MGHIYQDYPVLIGDQLSCQNGQDWIESTNPATEEPIGRVPACTSEHVDMAVEAAAKAQIEWAAMSIWERGGFLKKLATAIRERKEEIKSLEALDSGNTIGNLEGDLHKASNHFEYFAGLATEMKGDTVPASPNGLHITTREPFGVVGRIVPFNHPFMFATANLAAPLVAGNTVVLKTPETSPLSATIIAELCHKLLPPGVVNVLSGYGRPVGDRIARHPNVRRIGFTGSVGTGLAIQKAAAEICVKKITLELGGKNSLIIQDDADLQAAVSAAVAGMNFPWAGQSCGSTSRILVHESMYADAVDLAKSLLERIRIGNPLDPTSGMGPVNSAAQYERVTAHIEKGRKAGARLVTGGVRPAGSQFSKGYWIAPTLFADVEPDMHIATEEIFGPVMCFSSFSSDKEAIRLANATNYGLTASIFGADIKRTLRIAKQIRAGVIAVNSTKMHYVGMPFGGTKNSGIGGEECLEELLSYTETKALHIAL